MKKKITLGLVMVLVLLCGICIGTTVGASGQKTVVQATIDPTVKVTIDGVEKSFFDANGARIFPITYNGTTYLPLRDVCEKVAGYKVNWDQVTRSVAVSTKPSAEGVDLIDTYKLYDKKDAGCRVSSENKTEDVSGFTLTHWLWSSLGSWKKDQFTVASFNVLGKYDTLTFKYYATSDATLQVIGDNDTVLHEIEVSGGQVAQETTVNLLKTNQLTFKFISRTDSGTKAYVFDARLR